MNDRSPGADGQGADVHGADGPGASVQGAGAGVEGAEDEGADPRPADPVSLDVAGGVGTITLDSPANRNALSAAVRAGLRVALDTATANTAIRVIVLTHRGPVFCSGMDLKEEAVAGPGRQGVRELPAILRRISRCPKPVVARVGGPARAGGIGLLAAADIVVAATSATFAFTEVRIGLVPAVITVPVLHRVAPWAARELLLTGEVFTAARALQIGLVNAVDDDVDGCVDRYVRSLLAGEPTALAATKALLQDGLDDSDERYGRLLALSAAQFSSAEGAEGGRSFTEKRRPSWITELDR
jgi:methylglutaconyl-CoA hydratase